MATLTIDAFNDNGEALAQLGDRVNETAADAAANLADAAERASDALANAAAASDEALEPVKRSVAGAVKHHPVAVGVIVGAVLATGVAILVFRRRGSNDDDA